MQLVRLIVLFDDSESTNGEREQRISRFCWISLPSVQLCMVCGPSQAREAKLSMDSQQRSAESKASGAAAGSAASTVGGATGSSQTAPSLRVVATCRGYDIA